MTIAPPLTSLPLELLLLISEQLEAHDLVQLSRACRTLRHLGGCKNIAKAFVRHSVTADAAIRFLYAKVNRLDLVIELFRHVQDRKAFYPFVAELAGRLNDLKQLLAWRDEFGFIPPVALYGAAQSSCVETFDFLLPRVAWKDYNIGSVFVIIGSCGNRSLLHHLRTKYPEMVTLVRLVEVLANSASYGRIDFALEVFDSLPPRSGDTISCCALEITKAAAAKGDIKVFSEFIEMFQYDEDDRDDLATSAAYKNHADILRLQDESRNRACSLQRALKGAVEGNALQAFEYLLETEVDDWSRISGYHLIDALLVAVKKKRSEMVSRLMTYVPRNVLLRGAVKSTSFTDAVMLLKEYQTPDREEVDATGYLPVYEFVAYAGDVPDWKMAVWLIVLGLDEKARRAKPNIGDAERAHCRSVLPGAIGLARELNMSEFEISLISQFVDGQLEYSSD